MVDYARVSFHLTASSPSGLTLHSSERAVVRKSSRDPSPAFTPWTKALCISRQKTPGNEEEKRGWDNDIALATAKTIPHNFRVGCPQNECYDVNKTNSSSIGIRIYALIADIPGGAVLFDEGFRPICELAQLFRAMLTGLLWCVSPRLTISDSSWELFHCPPPLDTPARSRLRHNVAGETWLAWSEKKEEERVLFMSSKTKSRR